MATDFDFTPYRHLTHFMGACLGDTTEVVLYSFEDMNHSVIDIANPGISGISLGDPLTGFAIAAMKDKGKDGPPYYLNHITFSKEKLPLRSNSLIILDSQKNPLGMLSTHTDVSTYQAAAQLLQKLAFMPYGPEVGDKNVAVEMAVVQSSPVDMIQSVIQDVTQSVGLAVTRLTTVEKIEIVSRLNEEGFFLIKGAVSLVAQMISASDATIYRYLSNLTKPKG